MASPERDNVTPYTDDNKNVRVGTHIEIAEYVDGKKVKNTVIREVDSNKLRSSDVLNKRYDQE
jgi:hypothetical protein